MSPTWSISTTWPDAELQRYGRLRPDDDRHRRPPASPSATSSSHCATPIDVGVLNGTRLTLASIDSRQGNLHCRDDHHRSVRIPFRYAADGLLTHGYAMTIHKAQGATLTRALVLADDTMTAEHAYTALSRASVRTDLYIDSGDALEREAHAPTVSTPTAERLSRAFRRSSAQSLAIDHNPQLVPVDVLRAERRSAPARTHRPATGPQSRTTPTPTADQFAARHARTRHLATTGRPATTRTTRRRRPTAPPPRPQEPRTARAVGRR